MGPLLQTPTPTPSHTDIPHGDTPEHTQTPHHRHPSTHTTQTHIHIPHCQHTHSLSSASKGLEPLMVPFVDPQPAQLPPSYESTSKGRRPAHPVPPGDFSPTPVHQPPKALKVSRPLAAWQEDEHCSWGNLLPPRPQVHVHGGSKAGVCVRRRTHSSGGPGARRTLPHPPPRPASCPACLLPEQRSWWPASGIWPP